MKFLKLTAYTITAYLALNLVPQILHAGTQIDLADSSNWNIRIDGEQAGDQLGWYNTTKGDVNNDGKDDLLLTVNSPSGF